MSIRLAAAALALALPLDAAATTISATVVLDATGAISGAPIVAAPGDVVHIVFQLLPPPAGIAGYAFAFDADPGIAIEALDARFGGSSSIAADSSTFSFDNVLDADLASLTTVATIALRTSPDASFRTVLLRADGEIVLGDFSTVATTPGMVLTTTPEPDTLLLLALGITGLAWSRGRRTTARRRCVLPLGAVLVALGLAALPHAAVAAASFGDHLYEFVPGLFTWQDARAAAEARSIDGTPGYLATITSAAEQAFVSSLVGGAPAWLGGSDEAVEGTWVWQTGPEAGATFWKDGAPVNGAYAGWYPGEPNNFQNEDYLSAYRGGWFDWNIRMGMVVEYSFEQAGFSFAMGDGRIGAVRNESPPGERLVRLDIALPAGTLFDTAETLPGVEFAPFTMVAATGGASFVVPDNDALDGRSSATVAFNDFGPNDEIRLSADLDSSATPDGNARVEGTRVTATFASGSVLHGVVAARSATILGVTYPYSVRVARGADWDVDGVPDDVDVCPGVADPAQTDTGGVGLGSAPDGIGDACQCGDVSGDGRVTLLDAVMVQRALLQPPAAVLARPQLCDVNGDGHCTAADSVVLRQSQLRPPTARPASGCVPDLP